MSSNNNLCSPLLDRLFKLQESHQQCRLASRDYLLSLKSPPTDDLHSKDINKNMKFSYDLPSMDRVQLIDGGGMAGKPHPNSLLDSYSPYNERNETITEMDVPLSHHVSEDVAHSLPSKEDTSNDFISLEDQDSKSGPKFSYLRKGQGTSRFKSKALKGFRKNVSSDQNLLPKRRLEIKKNPDQSVPNNLELQRVSKPLDSIDQSAKVMDQKLDTFEKLEKLAEQDSFCSTSSKVMELLHDEATICSTPVSSQSSFIATMELTPILRGKHSNSLNKKYMGIVGDRSPVRNLFPLNVQCNFRKEFSPKKGTHVESNLNYNNVRNLDNSVAIGKNGQNGILKKTLPNVSPMLKVKFLDRGANILEYDNSDAQLNDTSAFSNDSDLISVSDLENLALLNFNVNVVHENTLDDSITISTNRNINAAVNRCWTSFTSAERKVPKDPPIRPLPQTLNAEREGSLTIKNLEPHIPQCSSVLPSKIPPTKASLSIESEDTEVKAHKLLLLSKVDDLKKEVNLFKRKNKSVEELITELQKERENLLQKQSEIQAEENTMKRLRCTIKSQRKVVKESERPSVIVSKKYQELDEKLRKLEIENTAMKKKIIALERKEKEFKKSERKAADKGESKAEPSQRTELDAKKESSSSSISRGNRKIDSTKPDRGNRSADVNVRSKQMLRPSSSRLPTKPKSPLGDQLSENETTAKPLSGESTEPMKKSKFVSKMECSPRLNSESIIGEIHSTRINVKSGCDSSSLSLKKGLHDLSTIQEREDENLDLKDRNFLLPEIFVPSNLSELKGPSQEGLTLMAPKMSEDSVEIVDVIAPVKDDAVDDEAELGVFHYPNGDKKVVDAEKIIYHYSVDDITHTKFKIDGKEEIEFASGQREIYFLDGSFQLIFPDHSSKSVYKDGTEVSVWRDGTTTRLNSNGTKVVHFPNGQKEVFEEDSVRRVYPDGTVKILHADGRQETRYRNGRVRIKDKNGNVRVYKTD